MFDIFLMQHRNIYTYSYLKKNLFHIIWALSIRNHLYHCLLYFVQQYVFEWSIYCVSNFCKTCIMLHGILLCMIMVIQTILVVLVERSNLYRLKIVQNQRWTIMCQTNMKYYLILAGNLKFQRKEATVHIPKNKPRCKIGLLSTFAAMCTCLWL